jgi:hypothetical protein
MIGAEMVEVTGVTVVILEFFYGPISEVSAPIEGFLDLLLPGCFDGLASESPLLSASGTDLVARVDH